MVRHIICCALAVCLGGVAEAQEKPLAVRRNGAAKAEAKTDQEPAASESAETGAHLRVVCHFDNEGYAKEALKTAEAAWAEASKLFAAEDAKSGEVGTIHLYRNAADYEKAEAKITGGRYRRDPAFAKPQDKAAHIVVQPECSDAALAELGVSALTRRQIVRQAVTLFRWMTAPEARSQPRWLADGAAAWIEERVMAAGKWSPAAEGDPGCCRAAQRVTALATEGHLPAVERILRDDIGELDEPSCDALRWSLLRFLSRQIDAKALAAIIAKGREARGTDAAEQVSAFAVRALGEGMKDIDGRFKASVQAFEPQWEEIFGSLSTAGDEWVEAAGTETNSIVWRNGPVERDAYVVEGEVKILPGKGRQLNLLLAQNQDGFFSVAFVGDYGVVLFQYHGAESRWEPLDEVKLDRLKVGPWHKFQVALGGDQVRVTVGDELALTQTLKGRKIGGRWGLGAQAGSVGLWRGLHIK